MVNILPGDIHQLKLSIIRLGNRDNNCSQGKMMINLNKIDKRGGEKVGDVSNHDMTLGAADISWLKCFKAVFHDTHFTFFCYNEDIFLP